MKKHKKGFTLIEILVAIAIVGILASVVLVSMSSYRIKANAAKTIASLSSAVTSMASCWSMGGHAIRPPKSGESTNVAICNLNTSYGKWPDISSNGYIYNLDQTGTTEDYTMASSQYSPGININEKKKSFHEWLFPTANATLMAAYPWLTKNNWYFCAENSADKQKICCNQTMNGCKIIDFYTACNSSVK
jgi:prepilin-type N-terminal cleavage/methylation domain-containing protein